MKKYSIYFIFAAVTVMLAAGCAKEQDEKKELDSRERVSIEVSYSDASGPVSSLSFNHSANQKVLNVDVNNEGLRWNLVSNREWCRVLPGEHIGSGSVTLEIDVNEGFQSRDAATLSFVAGEFSGFDLTVEQSATAFVIDKPFALSSKSGDSYQVKVTTPEDADWAWEPDEWISVVKVGAITKDGKKITTLEISSSYNPGDARYGEIRLTSADGNDALHLYQFGNEMIYNEDGDLFFPNEVEAEISFIAPAFIIKNIKVPDSGSYTSKDNGDGTVTVSIRFKENLSDCEEVKELPVSLVMNNGSSSEVRLPKIIQDYLPAGGLMTAKGMKLFAEAIENDGDLSNWETDGVVRVVQDVDMTGVTGWSGIGSNEHPFKGTLDGGGHSIVNLSNSNSPIFNYCEGAEIKNFGVAKNCSFKFSSGEVAGGIVTESKGSYFEKVSFAGTIEYNGTGSETFIGEIAGKADASSTFNSCKASGRLVHSSGENTTGVGYAGGIAGEILGEVKNCEFSGTIDCMCGIARMEIGGIIAHLPADVKASTNSFTGNINVECSSNKVFAGGLYGFIPDGSRSFDKSSDNSLFSGLIHISNFAANTNTQVFAGGLAGSVAKDVALSVKGYTIMTNFSLEHAVAHTADYLCVGGILGGCDPNATSGDLKFEDLTSQGKIDIIYTKDIASLILRCCVGGIAGLIRGNAAFISCKNKGYIGGGTSESLLYSGITAAKHYVVAMGGIAGLAYGAPVSFTSCSNEADLDNDQYNNASSENYKDNTAGRFHSSCTTGGILGAFNYFITPDENKATFEDCSNTGNMQAFRGFGGGIVGCAKNVEIKNCSWSNNAHFDNTYNSYNQSSFKGGIAGALTDAKVSGCKVKDVYIRAECMGSAENADSGGIVGRVLSGKPVTISDCYVYGNISYYLDKPADKKGYAAAIASTVQSNTEIKDCHVGGKVQGTSIITEALAKEKATGFGTCSVKDITLWDGK